jgi:hypothetical protein
VQRRGELPLCSIAGHTLDDEHFCRLKSGFEVQVHPDPLYRSRGRIGKIIILKIKTEFLREKKFQFFFYMVKKRILKNIP